MWELNHKKAECQRIHVFQPWCCGRFLRVPWTAQRSNQSILRKSALNIHWKDWCWSWSSSIGPPDGKCWLIGKDPHAGKVKVKVAQLCLTLCNPMDYRVHEILQARILEWIAFAFSRESSQPTDQAQVSLIAGIFVTSWATREAWCWKRLKANRERKQWQRMRCLDSITDSMDMNLSQVWEIV